MHIEIWNAQNIQATRERRAHCTHRCHQPGPRQPAWTSGPSWARPREVSGRRPAWRGCHLWRGGGRGTWTLQKFWLAVVWKKSTNTGRWILIRRQPEMPRRVCWAEMQILLGHLPHLQQDRGKRHLEVQQYLQTRPCSDGSEADTFELVVQNLGHLQAPHVAITASQRGAQPVKVWANIHRWMAIPVGNVQTFLPCLAPILKWHFWFDGFFQYPNYLGFLLLCCQNCKIMFLLTKNMILQFW